MPAIIVLEHIKARGVGFEPSSHTRGFYHISNQPISHIHYIPCIQILYVNKLTTSQLMHSA